MQNKKNSFFQDSYSETLETINDIKFTPREFDIMACILGGRGRKATATLISVAEKTVETHIRNIMRKLECNSQEGIRERIEKSDKFGRIKRHYIRLLTEASFEQCLQKIANKVTKENLSCGLLHWQKDNDQALFVHQLEGHLTLAGIKVLSKAREKYPSLAHLIQSIERQRLENFIYVPPDGQKDDETIEEFYKFSKTAPASFLILSEKEPSAIPQESKNISHIFLENEENYYYLFFEILKKIINNSNFDEIISDFKKQYKNLYERSEEFRPSTDLKCEEAIQVKPICGISLLNVLKQRKKWALGGGGCCLVSIIFLVLLMYSGQSPTIKQQNQIPAIPSIRSELIIPAETTLLDRPELMAQIEEKLKGEGSIQTVALVGMGGAGKTTLARQYGRFQKAPVVWEINAETKESLIDSFENLASGLSRTEEDKKQLKEIQDIKNSTEREKKILLFVKEKLRIHLKWLLIYDNVETFANIQKYFPYDPNTWGSGKVIITTRDIHIQNNTHIADTIPIKELNRSQKLSLFLRIKNRETRDQLTSAQKEKIKLFLEGIPPFPLDVSMAAYYMKATNISYEQYLENLSTYKNDFAIFQEKILKETSNYGKTRYNIITMSIKNLLNVDQDFADLLLFISLLDSQNIPRDLLVSYKNSHVVDEFIFYLKKYSLISGGEISPIHPIAVFSIHRSTQEISLSYLTKKMNLQKNNKLLESISNTLKDYIENIINTTNFLAMKPLLRHCKAFLKHDSTLLTEISRKSISNKLGGIYYHLNYYKMAKDILEKNLPRLNDESPNIETAQILEYLGDIYRNEGDYKKAKVLIEDSLTVYKNHYPENQIDIARALVSLGNAYRNLAEYKQAKDLIEEGLTVYKTHHPKNHLVIAQTLGYLGFLYSFLGDYEKAKDLIEESVILYKNHHPTNQPGVAQVLAYLGYVYKNLGDYKKAKEVTEKSLKIYKDYFGENNTSVACVLSYLGNIHRGLGSYEKAKNILEKSLIIYKNYYPENHIFVAWTLTYLGKIYRELGNYENAKTLLEQSLAIHREHFGHDNTRTAWVLAHLGTVYRELGYYEQAKTALEQSLGIYKKYFKEGHHKTTGILLKLGDVYKDLGHYEEARALLEQGLRLHEKNFGKNHVETARALQSLGQIYFLEGNLEVAESLINKALEIFEQNKHPQIYTCLENLSILYQKKFEQEKKKDFKNQAIAYLKQALKIIQSSFPENSPHSVRIQSKLKKFIEE